MESVLKVHVVEEDRGGQQTGFVTNLESRIESYLENVISRRLFPGGAFPVPDNSPHILPGIRTDYIEHDGTKALRSHARTVYVQIDLIVSIANCEFWTKKGHLLTDVTEDGPGR